MAYDRDAIVGCLKRHYDLLVRMAYLNPTTIQEPPPSGWSDDQLAIDILRAMGRSEKVIDLLRHLPYLHETKHYDEDIHIYPETMAISYRNDTGWFRGQTAESCQGKTLGYLCLMPFEEDCPPGFISLTYGNLATDWIIDIDEGVMFASDGNIVDANVPEDQPWRRGGKPRDIKDYFDEVYFDMVSLKVVPAPPAGRWGPAIIYGEGPEGQVRCT
ncbi:hypothetical protein P280DRAFT_403991 [Massarina eburnea CBS 473.64]|uniref:Uncharacterized protein n=1 Tax=Massarina eburnea CBS 473.64 TaxID=1395130 RepID=A0A6A6RUV8_9PLEO|nr:hypothetical protein P280DRAFT_403991 [Massarina eburnea CBS 473.64]